MKAAEKVALGFAGAALLVLCLGLAARNDAMWHPAAAFLPVVAAIGFGAVPAWRGYQFTVWIIAAVTAGMIYPGLFARLVPGTGPAWLIPTIVQIVMFGVGTQMSLRDFAGVLRMPWGVFVGIFCQFTVMPLVGYGLTKLFSLPEEIAAGVILIGSCSSGLASNMMVYLARANLALSITLTAVATLLAPLITPFWMKLLAGGLIAELEFSKMMLDIIQLVIVPIGAALLHDYLKHALPREQRYVFAAARAGALWLAARMIVGIEWASSGSAILPLVVTLATLLSSALVVGVIFHWFATMLRVVERFMPILSMLGIISYTAISTAAARDHLLAVGGTLFLAAAIHNSLGYVLGYWLSRAMGLDRQSARTVAFEVGLQNGGMATGLASKMGRLATVGLAAIVFSPWMNITGSILANYWRRRPVEPVADETG